MKTPLLNTYHDMGVWGNVHPSGRVKVHGLGWGPKSRFRKRRSSRLRKTRTVRIGRKSSHRSLASTDLGGGGGGLSASGGGGNDAGSRPSDGSSFLGMVTTTTSGIPVFLLLCKAVASAPLPQ